MREAVLIVGEDLGRLRALRERLEGLGIQAQAVSDPHSADEAAALIERLNLRSAASQAAEPGLQHESPTSVLRGSSPDLDEFAYIASHDLQEPLHVVTGFLQLLERRYRGRLDEEADRFIAYALEGTQHMRDLLNDLLAYSRVGRKEFNLELIATRELVDKALEALRTRLEETHAEVSIGLLPHVQGDRSRLTQVFQNLIENALTYHRDATPRVYLEGERRDGEAVFSVRDEGVGFEPEYAAQLFQPFRRLHERSRFSGNGIGLAMVKRIVERHGGRVWAEGRKGQGATFSFALPVRSEGAT